MKQLLQQPIAAFVYCNRQVPPSPTGATSPPATGDRLKAPCELRPR